MRIGKQKSTASSRLSLLHHVHIFITIPEMAALTSQSRSRGLARAVALSDPGVAAAI